jgi:small-conductance mechanosensitive channel
VAAAYLAVLDSEQQLSQERLAESQLRVSLLQRQLMFATPGASFTQADLDQVVTRIERQREQLERELADTHLQRLAAAQALTSAQDELRALQAQGKGGPAESQALELVSTREVQFETIAAANYGLRLMLEATSVERTMWELRFAAHESRSVNTLSESARRLATFIGRLETWREYVRQQLEGCSSQLQVQETRLASLATDSDLLPLARERLAALRQREWLLQRVVRTVERLVRLTERWAEGIRSAEKQLPLTGRLLNVFSDARSFLNRLWNFEIFIAEDTIVVEGQKITGKRSVTIGKTAMAMVILVVGYWLTGLLTSFSEPFIVKRLQIEPNQANLIRRWLRALLVVCLVLFSLISVKIPLTVFAFAGGALAIGLGFGMQNLLKNFVSGLILLFEQPFRVGDVLDVGGQRGKVTQIGLRASVLELWDGTETLIPNSSLLENNVSNWTYSSRKVRFSISVGAAYGSDTRRVIQLLGEVAERHGLVEKDPKPQVYFTNFADSALTFELRFWVDVIRNNAAQVGSDLRLMIAGAFAENQITIAFPQRDIHLHAPGGIPVQIVPPGGELPPAVAPPRTAPGEGVDALKL